MRSLIRKEALKTDPEAQTLEDVVDLTFLESYLDEFVAKHPDYDEAKFVDILQKTGKKMSARGRDAALTLISPPPALLPVIRKAMTLMDPKAHWDTSAGLPDGVFRSSSSSFSAPLSRLRHRPCWITQRRLQY